jgi:mRNA interferase RelE/StbE
VAEKNSQNWTIRVSSKAGKYFTKLSASTKNAVKAELTLLSSYESPLQHPDARPLLGPFKGMHRLRVGKYRVIFAVLEKQRIIAVVNIAPRGDVYK